MKGWLFPQVLAIAKRWLAECVTCKDNTFPQLLLLIEFAHDAADRIYKAIVESAAGTPALKPILRPYDVVGSTRYVDFDTTKAVYPTAAAKCHVSHVVADTGVVGTEDGAGARGDAGGRALREEPGPGLHYSVHAERRREAVLPGLHRATSGDSQPDHRSQRRSAEGQGREGDDGADACGCRR